MRGGARGAVRDNTKRAEAQGVGQTAAGRWECTLFGRLEGGSRSSSSSPANRSAGSCFVRRRVVTPKGVRGTAVEGVCIHAVTTSVCRLRTARRRSHKLERRPTSSPLLWVSQDGAPPRVEEGRRQVAAQTTCGAVGPLFATGRRRVWMCVALWFVWTGALVTCARGAPYLLREQLCKLFPAQKQTAPTRCDSTAPDARTRSGTRPKAAFGAGGDSGAERYAPGHPGVSR